MEQLDIIKIGGENAGTDLETTLNYVGNNTESAQVLVVSAMRNDDFNTTDVLKDVAESLQDGDLEIATKLFQSIIDFHKQALLDQEGENIIEEIESIFKDILLCFPDNLGKSLSEKNDFTINVLGEKVSLLGLGEKISAIVHSRLIEESGIGSKLVDTENIIINEREEYTQEVIKYFSDTVQNILKNGNIPVIGGFIGNIPGGILKNIDRGYTDATASLVALSQNEYYQKTRLNIFKSVQGILAVDPRLFPSGTKINHISHMDYLTARELTGGSIGGKAKFLHEYALSQNIMDAGIDLRIMNPQTPDISTTVGKYKLSTSKGIEIVNKRDNISFVKITKAAFSEGVGDVERIFDIVKSHGFGIDMITTSETQLSFSIETDNYEGLKNVKASVEQDFFHGNISDINYIEIQKNMSLIHCIGQNLDDTYQISIAQSILALEEGNIKIHTIGGEREKGAIIFAVEEKDAKISLQILAKHFDLVQNFK